MIVTCFILVHTWAARTEPHFPPLPPAESLSIRFQRSPRSSVCEEKSALIRQAKRIKHTKTTERYDAESYRLFPYSECHYSPCLHNLFDQATSADSQVHSPLTDGLQMQVAVASRRPARASVVVKANKLDNAVSQGPKLALIVPGKKQPGRRVQ